MPVRRKKRATPMRFRPPLPTELGVYNPGDWGAPPPEGTGVDWEAGHRAAYARFKQACQDWFEAHKHVQVDPSTAPPSDVPWCGEFDEHDCLGADCPRRPPMRDNETVSRQHYESETPTDE